MIDRSFNYLTAPLRLSKTDEAVFVKEALPEMVADWRVRKEPAGLKAKQQLIDEMPELERRGKQQEQIGERNCAAAVAKVERARQDLARPRRA